MEKYRKEVNKEEIKKNKKIKEEIKKKRKEKKIILFIPVNIKI